MLTFSLWLLMSLSGIKGNTVADAMIPLQTVQPTLAISIAVPEEGGRRIISLSTADPHVDVVIRNVSNQPLNFYAQDCSAGYDTLRLELLRIDDKALPQPIVVQRPPMGWYANDIRTVTLEPGDTMVREVHFSQDRVVGGIPYKNFPAMKAGDSHKIEMRAVFTVRGGGNPFTVIGVETSSPLWTGSIASDTHEYQVVQCLP